MKIYIMTDMEGVSGIWSDVQVSGNNPEYERARKLLGADVNAAVAGAFEGGATEVVVADGHGVPPFNFIIGELDERARYERSGGPPGWSLDMSYAGLFAVGCHAMAGTLQAFLDHTQSSTSWFHYYINGTRYGEIGQWAAWAGHYGVPLLFVSGDRAACEEAQRQFPGVETAAVKEALGGRQRAVCLHPARAGELIRAGARRSMALTGKLKAWKLTPPIEIKLEVTRADYVDGLAGRPGVERLDARSVRKTVNSALDILNF